MKLMRPLRAAMVAAAVLAGLAGPALPQTLTYNPKHYENNDPIWALFNQTQVVADTVRGEDRATFPPSLVARRARPLKISGFILPLETSTRSTHFMLVRRNTGCPFCPPNAPTEAVEVFSRAPVSYTGEEISMTGQLALVANSDQGLFFQLKSAELQTRPG